MIKAKMEIREAPPRKIVAYKSKVLNSVYVPRTIKEGGGYYDKYGKFHPMDYSHIPESTWDNYYTPLYEGSTIEITAITTKEITL